MQKTFCTVSDRNDERYFDMILPNVVGVKMLITVNYKEILN